MNLKLPRTLHIEGSRVPTGGVDPEAIQFEQLKNQFLVIEEKVDGAGVSIGLDSHFDLIINHRGSKAIGKEFRALYEWAEDYWEDLVYLLGERYILFGEWMRNKHTIFYDNLPHDFLESDIYDKEKKIWLSTNARNKLLKEAGFINQVPVIAALKPSALYQITNLVGPSKYQTSEWKESLKKKAEMFGASYEKVLTETDQSGLMEGLYIKHEDDFQVLDRYKYVRYEFLQCILNSGSHVRDRIPVYNALENETF